jgi:two-component system CheB/CheR fusion protein
MIQEDQLETSTTSQPTQRRVLLVDDNDDARMLLAEILRSYGHDVKTASDGPSALELLDTFKPQIAVLDIGLPNMDGFELATRIRGRHGGEHIRLIALTGYGQPGDEARGKRAGFDVHLVKPVDVNRLLEQFSPPVA